MKIVIEPEIVTMTRYRWSLCTEEGTQIAKGCKTYADKELAARDASAFRTAARQSMIFDPLGNIVPFEKLPSST